MADEASIRRFHDSLERATGAAGFYDGFYERFIHQSPEVAAIFRGRDMERIKQKLRMTLEMVSDTAAEKPGLGMYLELLGNVHNRLHISHAMFNQWRNALVETAAACDPEFDEQIRRDWEQAIDTVIRRMHEHRRGNGAAMGGGG